MITGDGGDVAMLDALQVTYLTLTHVLSRVWYIVRDDRTGGPSTM